MSRPFSLNLSRAIFCVMGVNLQFVSLAIQSVSREFLGSKICHGRNFASRALFSKIVTGTQKSVTVERKKTVEKIYLKIGLFFVDQCLAPLSLSRISKTYRAVFEIASSFGRSQKTILPINSFFIAIFRGFFKGICRSPRGSADPLGFR